MQANLANGLVGHVPPVYLPKAGHLSPKKPSHKVFF